MREKKVLEQAKNGPANFIYLLFHFFKVLMRI